MKRNKIIGIAIALLLVLVTSVAAFASVSRNINGSWFKSVASHGGEMLTIHYNPATGHASAIYEETYTHGSEQYFRLSGRLRNGYLELSGRGVCRGRSTSMRIRVTQTGPNTLKSVTGNGSVYYFYR